MTEIWPLRPNWRGSYSVSYAYLTDIIRSEGGREQRRALRQAPRRSVSFLVTVAPERFVALSRTVASRQAAPLLLPELTRKTRLSTPTPESGFTAVVEAVPAWVQNGTKVMLVEGDRAEAHEVATVAGSTITFTAPSAQEWASGTWLCQAVDVRLSPNLNFTGPVRGVREGRVSFDVEPGSEVAAAPAAAELTWNGREVFLEPANWAQGQQHRFERPTDVVDYERGVRSIFLPVAFNVHTWTADYLRKGPQAVERLIDFFHRQMGCRGEFYAPTDEPDIALKQSSASGSLSLMVAGQEFAAAYGGDAVHKAISVLMRNGDRFFRSVSDVVTAGGDSVIQLASALPQTITPSNVRAISWMPVRRLASDELTVEWITDEVAQVRLTFQTLEALPAEVPA